ncbi:hypothetical protein [Pleionea sp. CnH1-48]|uniref:hypothetical protein n=1 Tax=Pleionea sp. CnH1-48 TaxID=2954494 RepID=UPI002097A186|nr:hypothetical protein [Pleionea sp. CnH1-48]MCO7227043.1 hypothetical protein [Pleionea sp. CnH1-48]
MKKLIMAAALLFSTFTFALEKPLNKVCEGCTDSHIKKLFKNYLKKQYDGLSCNYGSSTCSDDGGAVFSEQWLVYTGEGSNKGDKYIGSINSYGTPTIIKAWALMPADRDILSRIDRMIEIGNEFLEALKNNPHNQPQEEKQTTNAEACDPSKLHPFDYFNGRVEQKVNDYIWKQARFWEDELEPIGYTLGVQLFGGGVSANMNFGVTGGTDYYPIGGGRIYFTMVRNGGVYVPVLNIGYSRTPTGSTLISFFKPDGKGGFKINTSAHKTFANECEEDKFEEAVKKLGWEVEDTNKQDWHREIGSNGQCGYVGHDLGGYTYRYQTYVYVCTQKGNEGKCGRVYTTHEHTVKFPVASQHENERCGNVFPQQFGINIP